MFWAFSVIPQTKSDGTVRALSPLGYRDELSLEWHAAATVCGLVGSLCQLTLARDLSGSQLV